MKRMTGLTASEMAKILGRKVKTVRQQIFLAGIKPKTKEAVYGDEVLEILRAIKPQGRPKKKKDEHT
ncbi:MAG: hypothetical protein LBI04_01940 [Treponema sp.]|jgi:DNA-directed RNA polymerase specialized sigma24 family protein|nr:hypothetical protein [Treponema sp.]